MDNVEECHWITFITALTAFASSANPLDVTQPRDHTFDAAASASPPTCSTDGELEELFKCLDTNQDGFLSMSDDAVTLPPAVFDIFSLIVDTDGDGQWSMEELGQVPEISEYIDITQEDNVFVLYLKDTLLTKKKELTELLSQPLVIGIGATVVVIIAMKKGSEYLQEQGAAAERSDERNKAILRAERFKQIRRKNERRTLQRKINKLKEEYTAKLKEELTKIPTDKEVESLTVPDPKPKPLVLRF